MEDKKIAIYSRKSKFTGKGESIENQIEECRRYANLFFKTPEDYEFLIYEDEGFSGGNVDRPKFKELLRDVRKGLICKVMCYRLDRMSRSVSDFAPIVRELEDLNVDFVSVKENFDTNLPMGKAMLQITMVFAELERNTIAERIRDNMLGLARTGRWLGGVTPTGYRSEPVESVQVEGKIKKAYKLTEIPEEKDLVQLIFQKYLEMKSLTKLDTYLCQNGIKSRQGIEFTRFTLKNILQNPVYAAADKATYDYFYEKNVSLFGEEAEYNGKTGIMAYNKTVQKPHQSNKARAYSDWIVATGRHTPLISGEDWVKVQDILEGNKDKRYRAPQKNTALLSGLLLCKSCGSFMRPKLSSRTYEDGTQKYTYMCELKEKSKSVKCGCKNIDGRELDRLIVEKVSELTAPDSMLYNSLKELSQNCFDSDVISKDELKIKRSTYQNNENKIKNLFNKAAEVSDNDTANELINTAMDLKKQNSELLKTIQAETKDDNSTICDKETADLVLNIIETYYNTFDKLDIMSRRGLFKILVEKVEFDGTDVDLYLLSTDKNRDVKLSVPAGEDSK